MSRYSEGIIAQALNDKETNIGFRLVEGDLKKLKEKNEKNRQVFLNRRPVDKKRS